MSMERKDDSKKALEGKESKEVKKDGKLHNNIKVATRSNKTEKDETNKFFTDKRTSSIESSVSKTKLFIVGQKFVSMNDSKID